MKSYVETINKMAQESRVTDDIKMTHTGINTPESDEERAARTGLESVRMTDNQSKEVQKTPNRVSLDSILAKVQHTDFINPERHPHMTIAMLTLTNGFIILGKSTPADPENFNAELGKKFATEDAIRQIWVLEAYLLREKMTNEET